MDSDSHFFIEETDLEILMHKDVHFGGSFPLMIDYYKEEGKGIQEAFELQRMEELYAMDEASPTPLSQQLLSAEQKQEMKKAKEAYEALEGFYNLRECPAQKLADLILSSDEDPRPEIEAICSLGKAAIPLLMPLLRREEYYNPLFPGYGMAPFHAAECLGILQVQEAVVPLFEALARAEFFGEEILVEALFRIGDPAKEYLLQKVQKMPLSKENENAAIVLSRFKEDPQVVSTCLCLLELPQVQQKSSLFVYLLLCLESLDAEQKGRFQSLMKLPLPQDLQEELRWTWKHLA